MKNYIADGLNSLLAICFFGFTLILMMGAMPSVYLWFEPIYLSTSNEFAKFVIRLGPIFIFVTMVVALVWAAIDISPLGTRKQPEQEA